MKNRLTQASSKLWCAVWLFLASVSTALAAPVASVIDINGDVTLVRKDNRNKIGLFDHLFVEDRLQLSGNMRLVLTHNATRSEYSFVAPVEVEITAEGVKLHSGAQPKTRLLTELAVAAVGAGTSGSRVVVGATPMRGASQQRTTPSNGETILSITPEFSWQAMNSASEYVLVLKNEEGETRLETRTSRTTWQIDKAQPLDWGASYDWTLSNKPGEKPFSLFATFKVISRSDRDALSRLEPKENASFAASVTYARALEHLGAHTAARSVWARLAAQRPDLPQLEALAKGKPGAPPSAQ